MYTIPPATSPCMADDGWNIGRDLVSQAVYSAIALAITGLYGFWTNYRDLSKNAPNLYSKLEKVVCLLGDMKDISKDAEFDAALTEIERADVGKSLARLEGASKLLQQQIEPFQHPDSQDADSPASAVIAGFARLKIAGVHQESKVQSAVEHFLSELDRFRDDLAELIQRHQFKLNEESVEKWLAKTRYRFTHEIYQLGVQNPSSFSMQEVEEFNLNGRYELFEPCPSPPDSAELLPLRIYRYFSIYKQRGIVLAEQKIGPYHYSQNRDTRIHENDSENIRAVYSLVRQFRSANKSYNEKFAVMPCQGFYCNRDGTILIIWEPPFPTSIDNPPPFMTLQQDLLNFAARPHPSGRNVTFIRIAKRMVRAMYELLQARWYHRTFCSNNVIAFNDNWENAYLVGFRTARLMDGHSEPLSRPSVSWNERYFQHPERNQNGKPRAAAFRMKHDIYSLGIMLLELQKGKAFGVDTEMKRTWENRSESSVAAEFQRSARDKAGPLFLGMDFIPPIVFCLAGFESVDRGSVIQRSWGNSAGKWWM